MPRPNNSSKDLWALGIVATGLGASLFILFFFAPDQHPFYPRCLFLVLTGWQCPGCGALRATHQLLHGNLTAAFHLNALLVVMLPAILALAARYAWHVARGRSRPGNPFPSQVWIWAVAALLLGFGLWRNL